MDIIYMFDVDGTLTPPKQKMDPKFRKEFLKWAEGKEVYLVSGGSFVRICDQLGGDVMDEIAGVFACMGNVYYKKKGDEPRAWIFGYERQFKPPTGLAPKLAKIVKASVYPVKTGKHTDTRTGMINFSIVGGEATQSQRDAYEKYDLEHKEREKIVAILQDEYPKLDFVIGGAVSIDIFAKGQDKSQVIREHFKDLPEDAIIHFIGDRIPYPGNDYAIAQLVGQRPYGYTYSVVSWKETAALLNSL